MEQQNKFNNKLGILGWLSGGRYGIERYAYSLHRACGLGLILYFIMHIFVTTSRVFGSGAWQETMSSVEGPLFKFGEFLIFFAFAYHGINGIRLILTEFGIFMGKPMMPDYPYKQSTLRQRPVLIVVMALAAILTLVGGWDFYLAK